jgi:capsular exopolysaccharide synthesis family protein
MPSENQHLTLRDYARTLRQGRLMIVVLTAIGLAAALGIALASKKTYTAQASVQVQDPSQYYGAVGTAVASTETPQELASAAAQTTTSAAVAAKVKRELGTTMTLSQLESSVSASVDTSSNFVLVQANSHTASGAAALANAFAGQSVNIANNNARLQFSNEAKALSSRIVALRATAGNGDAIIELQTERARFLALSNFATPATVVQTASAPSSPSSPKPVFDALLGAVIGFIIAILIAFARSAVDRRVRDGQEVEELLGVQVLGDLREDALGRSPSRDNGLGPLSPADIESIRIIRRNLDYLNGNASACSVAVTSALPQEGKSTVAAALAFASASIGRRTLLIEADMRRPVLAARLDLKPRPGLVDLLGGSVSAEDVRQTVAVSASENGSAPSDDSLTCVVAGSPTDHADELLSSKAFELMLKDASDEYDLVVLDCAPVLPVVDTLEIISHVGSIVLCVRAHQTTRDQVLAAKAAILRSPARPVGAVVTALAADDDYGSYAYSYAYKSSST